MVLPTRVDPTGVTGPTRSQSRSEEWRRSSQGFYLPSYVDHDPPEQRIAEASVVISPGSAATGWAALCWLNGRWFDGRSTGGTYRPVTIAIGTHDLRAQPGIAVTGERLGAANVLVVDGLPIASPSHAVSFEMRYANSDVDAAIVLDLAAFSDLVSIEEMSDRLANQNGWTGVPRARRALGLADENSWSPRESRMRILWSTDTGFPVPLTNRPVFDLHGRHLATPDLIDPVSGVAGEYDSKLHLGRARDVDRDALYQMHDIELVKMITADNADPAGFMRRLRGAYARASRQPTSGRTWTIDPPPGWVPTVTVEQRRALTDDQRRRFLAHRSA